MIKLGKKTTATLLTAIIILSIFTVAIPVNALVTVVEVQVSSDPIMAGGTTSIRMGIRTSGAVDLWTGTFTVTDPDGGTSTAVVSGCGGTGALNWYSKIYPTEFTAGATTAIAGTYTISATAATAGQTPVIEGTGSFVVSPIPSGTLSIDTNPVKGEVFVDVVPWGTAPQSQDVAVGTYTISFGDMAGYTTPSDEEAVVTEDTTTTITGTYVLIQPSSIYPIVVALDGVDTVFIAAHTSDPADGNWISLSGGTSVTLPTMTIIYDGLKSASYTKDEVTVTIDSSFDKGQATYPIPTHQVYSPEQTITAKFWGSTALNGESVKFKLLKLTSLTEAKDIFTEAFKGNLDPLKIKLGGAWTSTTTVLEGDCDATADIPEQTVGDYLLIVVKEVTGPPYELYIHSATAIEVIDYDLQVTAPSPVEKGDNLIVNLELVSAPPGTYMYGAVMIKTTAYSGEIKLSTDGTVLTTKIYLNNQLIGNGALASELILGTMNPIELAQYAIELMATFESDEIAFRMNLVGSTTETISFSTSSLLTGDYILLVGALKDLGSRAVGVHQTTVTIIPSGLPVADAGGPYTGKPGVLITFDGSKSDDPDGTIESYAWNFGDGGTATIESPSHKYSAAGTYTVTLTVTDNDGLTSLPDTTTAKISTPSTPPPYIPPMNKLPVAEAGPNQTVYVNEATHFSGTESQDPDGTIVFYKWDFGDGEIAYAENVSHTYQEPGNYTVTLTVRDNLYGIASDTCTITVEEFPIIVPPVPPYLDNLNITPAVIELGDNVTISFDIRNLDSQSIDYGVDIYIENVNVTRIWVELGSYEFKTVSHTITPDTVGIYNVTIHGMTGNFTIEVPEIPLKPAEFVVSDLTITPETAELTADIDDWTFRITVNVTNIGEQEGTHTVDLKVDGTVVESGTVTLKGGEKTMIIYDVTRGVGSYTVEVDGLTGSFTVKAPPKPAEFEISNLVVNPREVEPEASVTVSATITNVGDESGGLIIEFKLDGRVSETKSVALNGGESETVTFTTSSEEEGSHSVEIDGLSGSFTVEAPPSKDKILFWFAIIVIIVAIALYVIWERTDWIDQLSARLKQ